MSIKTSSRPLSLCLLFTLTIALALPAEAQRRRRRGKAPPGPKPLRIGMVLDGPLQPEWTRMVKRLQKEIGLIVGSSRTLSFPTDKTIDGGWKLDAIRAGFDKLLADPEVDLILAVGFIGPLDVARRKTLPKPVLAPLVGDPRVSGLPVDKAGKTSGKKNFSYLVYSSRFAEDVATFKRLIRTPTQHVLVDKLMLSWIPKLKAVAAAAAKKVGVKLTLVPVETTAQQALTALPEDAKAVYILPLPRLSDAERIKLLAGLQRRRLPTFSASGRAEVERGALATQQRGVDLLRAARRTALNVERIVRGDKPETFSIHLERRRKLLLNMAVARAIGWHPDWRVLVYAEKVGATKLARGRKLALEQAIREGLRRNWDVIAARHGLAAREMQVKGSYAAFMPRIDGSFSHTTIRKEVAEATNGSQAWHQGKLAATLKQFLFIEPQLANVTIQKALRRGQRASLRQTRLDVGAAVAKTFLDLLRAQTNFQIQRNNARLTDANLESAQVRRRVGAGGPTDVYRWQSKLASDRNNTVLAQTLLAKSRIQLNQLLRRPQLQAIEAIEPKGWDGGMLPESKRLRSFVRTPARFIAFGNFLVARALKASPELATLRANVAAKKRELLSRKRALWLPTAQLQGEISYIPYRKFVDVEPINIPGLGEFAFDFNLPRFSWFIGFGINIPIFTGLEQTYQREQADRELLQLRAKLRGAKLGIETRVRAAVNDVRARTAGLFFTRRSAKAAKKNLKVVQDAYARGVASTVTLLDAQNSALAAQLAAATAVYDLQAALIELQRATGRFELLVDAKERKAWLDDFERYLRKNKGRIGRFQIAPDGGLINVKLVAPRPTAAKPGPRESEQRDGAAKAK